MISSVQTPHSETLCWPPSGEDHSNICNQVNTNTYTDTNWFDKRPKVYN